jgi:hypothetical protein
VNGDTSRTPTATAAPEPAAAKKKRVPRIGDDVHFVGYTETEPLSARICRIMLRPGLAPIANLFVFTPTGAGVPQYQSAYSELNEPGTWHYPA